jgi:hypothetical protein
MNNHIIAMSSILAAGIGIFGFLAWFFRNRAGVWTRIIAIFGLGLSMTALVLVTVLGEQVAALCTKVTPVVEAEFTPVPANSFLLNPNNASSIVAEVSEAKVPPTADTVLCAAYIQAAPEPTSSPKRGEIRFYVRSEGKNGPVNYPLYSIIWDLPGSYNSSISHLWLPMPKDGKIYLSTSRALEGKDSWLRLEILGYR